MADTKELSNHMAGAKSRVHILAVATVTNGTNALVRHLVVVQALTANDGNIDELEHCFGSAS